jgi:hypothetical protein
LPHLYPGRRRLACELAAGLQRVHPHARRVAPARQLLEQHHHGEPVVVAPLVVQRHRRRARRARFRPYTPTPSQPCEWHLELGEEWSCQLDRQLVRCPRNGSSSWVYATPLNHNPEGRWRMCVGVIAYRLLRALPSTSLALHFSLHKVMKRSATESDEPGCGWEMQLKCNSINKRSWRHRIGIEKLSR